MPSTTRHTFAAIAVAAMTVAACTPKAEHAAQNETSSTTSDSASSGTSANAPAKPTPTSNNTAWVVTDSGIGPVVVGMTEQQFADAFGGHLVLAGECTMLPLPNKLANVTVMFVDKKVVRIDVRNDTVATAVGAKIGDTEARIRAFYPNVQTQPHKYTDGHYLIVLPADTTKDLRRIIFETDGNKVTRYRAGTMPQVGWVEGCS